MQMRVLGFSWDKDALPTGLGATAVFERIQEVSGEEFKGHIGAVTKMNSWWAGVIRFIREVPAERGVM
jgi:hypothetical protein